MNNSQLTHPQAPGPVGGSHHRPQPGTLAALAWAGIAGPLLFTATFLAQEAFRIEEYSPVAEPVSALEAGPGGWVQQVNFVVFGLLTVAYAFGLHRGVRPTRAGVLGPGVLIVSGIGLVLAGVFPLREDAAGITYDPGGHLVAGFTYFLSSALGLLVLSRRLARDTRWRGLSPYVLTAGALILLGFVLTRLLVMPQDGLLHDWAGVVQRVLILGVLFPCQVVLARRLLQVSRGR